MRDLAGLNNQGLQKRKIHRMRPLAYSISLLMPLAFNMAQAQQDPGIEEIVVQGTATGTGIRGVAPVGSPSISMSRGDLLESPVRNAASIIADLPQGSQIGSGIAEGSGGNGGGQRGLNLRGLGPNASLMLINGHRPVGQGISSVTSDPNAVPFAAIERVEAVLDGVSSVYGSDAVAGVVNFILRDQFEGVDVKLTGESGAWDSRGIEIVAGHSWDNANLMVGLVDQNRGSWDRNERGYLMEDLRPYGGNDARGLGSRPSAGMPGVIQLRSRELLGIPENFVGETVTDPETGRTYKRPTLAEIQAAEVNLVDAGNYETYLGEEDERKAFARFRVDLTDTLRVTYTGMLSKRVTSNRGFDTLPIAVTEDSPYFIPGLGERYSVIYNSVEAGLPWPVGTDATTTNHFVDVEWDIGEWLFTGSFTSGMTEGSDIDRPERNNAALTNDPAGTPAGYLNYADFGNDPQWLNPYLTDNQPGVQNLIGHTVRMGRQEQESVRVGLEGPVWELPGGTVRTNVGAEHLSSYHWNKLNQTVRFYDKTDFVLRDTDIDRDVSSVFGEVYIPIIGTANELPGVQSFVVNLSVRHDEYSDFGGTTNPRIGLRWDVNDSVSLRGSAGTAFRAPSLDQVNPGVNSTLTRTTMQVDPALADEFAITIPQSGETDIFTRGGRNPDLGPEKADMWSVGIDYTPVQIDGLNIQLNYYSVEYEDRIENLPNWEQALSSPGNRDQYSPYIYPITQPAGCVAGQLDSYHPQFQQFLSLKGTRFAGEPTDCDVTAIIDTGLQNVGSVNQKGVDFQMSYNMITDLGVWGISTNVAKIVELERTLIDGGEWFEVLDRIGWQNSLRANVRLSWMQENWNAAITSKTEGGYTNDQTPTVNGMQLPTHEVNSWTTLDATLSYTIPEGDSWSSGVEVRVGAQNLTDKEPPIVLNDSNAIDANVHNPFGRILSLELSKRF